MEKMEILMVSMTYNEKLDYLNSLFELECTGNGEYRLRRKKRIQGQARGKIAGFVRHNKRNIRINYLRYYVEDVVDFMLKKRNTLAPNGR